MLHSTNKYGGYFKSEHYSPMKEMGDSYQHIYITSDEEIKEGDWIIENNNLGKCTNELWAKRGASILTKKIILTTDQDLIADGVQAIDDEFLEWFMKNSSCEWVEVNHFGMCCGNQSIAQCINCNQYNPVYKIIIPKEELEQETVEEREPYWELVDKKAEKNNTIDLDAYANGIRDGAKWQAERMYSEEDLKRAFEAGHKKGFSGYPNTENWKELPFENWFEQIKKK